MIDELDYQHLRDMYISHMSSIDCKYNKTGICKVLGISRPSLYKLIDKYPDMDSIIHERLKKQYNTLGNAALRRIKDLIEKTSNPAILKMGLEIGKHYVDTSVITNRYDDMKEEDIDKTLINLLNKARNKRNKQT